MREGCFGILDRGTERRTQREIKKEVEGEGIWKVQICNFLKLDRCVCWFLRENASENQIKSLQLQVLAKMKRETDIDKDIDIQIQWWELINGLYGGDRSGN